MIDLYAPKTSKLDVIKNWLKNRFSFLKNPFSLFYYALLLLACAFGFYFLHIVTNNFTSPWSGDYVLQYIPFAFNYYDDWWSFFETGVFPHWDMNIFLGADTVTSDGYYIMFSPFFWPLLLTPRSWIPQMLVIISMFRMVLAGLFFRLYLKKLGCNERFARIGGIVYAFSGFTSYFIWFNNFLDIVVLLPLVLLGIEHVLKDKRPWLLAMALGMIGIANFLFFPAIIIMTFVYSIFRYFQLIKNNDWKSNLGILGVGFVGYVLAIGIGGCLLIPGLVTSMSDPKIEGGKYLTQLLDAFKGHDFTAICNLLFVWDKVPGGNAYWQGMPIIELFIPPVTCRHNPLLNFATGNTFDNNAGSIWMGLTLLLFLFPAIIDSAKNKKWSHFIAIAIVLLALFTPFSYFLLFGGSKAYSRWFIMIPAVMIPYVCLYLSKTEKPSIKILSCGLAFVALGIMASGLLAHHYVETVDIYGRELEFFLPFPGVLFIELAYVVLVYLLFMYHFHKKHIKSVFSYLVFIETTAVGIFVTVGHGYTHPNFGNGGAVNNQNLYNTVNRINNHDDSFFRMYTDMNVKSKSDNNANYNNYNGATMFNTLYNFNTRQFKFWSSITDSTGSWSAAYNEKRQALDNFLGFKYYVMNKNWETIKGINSDAYHVNVPFGYTYREDLSDANNIVFENKNINQLGYAFDDVYVYDADDPFYSLGKNGGGFQVLRNEAMYLSQGIIDDETFKGFSDEDKSSLNYSSTLKTIEDYGYKKALINDDKYAGSSLFGNPYSKSYYKVANSSKYDVNKLAEIPLTYEKMNWREIQETQQNKSGDVFIFIDKKDPITKKLLPFSDEALAIYINATFEQNHKSDIYLLNKDGKIITFDNHSDDKGFSTNSKNIRGLYSDEPIYQIAIYPRYYGWGDYSFYMEEKSTWDNRIANLTPLENVKYVDANTFTFDTNFDKAKMVVTNIAFEKGWKISAFNNDTETILKPFLADGGFVGFIAPKGEYSYVMNYKNPDFDFAEKITGISYSIVLASYCIYVAIDLDRQRKRSLNEISFRA